MQQEQKHTCEPYSFLGLMYRTTLQQDATIDTCKRKSLETEVLPCSSLLLYLYAVFHIRVFVMFLNALFYVVSFLFCFEIAFFISSRPIEAIVYLAFLSL